MNGRTVTFNNDLRLTTDSLTTTSATLYSATRGYDAVGNVVSEDTQLGASTTTDNQLFCYDEQNQLTWAGATGTSPCNGAVSSGTLTSAYYSQAYTYDAQGRLTSASLGSYTYGDASHPHAVTAIGSGAYGASYDAAGDMTCRAPNSSVTCAGTPTGATLTYDAERRLAHWQNTPTTPTVQDDSLYDGAGQRVEQYVNTSGTITATAYLAGGVEEVSGGVITKYLGAKGLPTAVRVGTAGALNYLASDGLGSVSVAVDGSGNLVASQLYGPYGTARYSSGTMPTSKGFTGQRADTTSGLDYYGARYYDPVAGQFVSADSVANGLSRYAYVGGNPETATDPSGHLRECWNCDGNGSSPSDGGTTYVPPSILAAFIPAAPVCHAGSCSQQNLKNIPQDPTATQVVQMQQHAANTAENYANFFLYLSWGLGILMGTLLLLQATLFAGNVVINAIITGMLIAIPELILDSNAVQAIFQNEASNPGIITPGRIASDSQLAASDIGNSDLLELGGGSISILGTVSRYMAKSAAKAEAAPGTDAATGATGIAEAVTAVSYFLTIGVGSVAMGTIAQNGFDTESSQL